MKHRSNGSAALTTLGLAVTSFVLVASFGSWFEQSDPKRACHGQKGSLHRNVGADGKKSKGGFVSLSSTVDKGVFVAPEAGVCQNASVLGKSRVEERAFVFGSAKVSDRVRLFGDARVFQKAEVSEDAQVSGRAAVYGSAKVSGQAKVHGDALVGGDAVITGTAVVGGKARILTGRIEEGVHLGDKDGEIAACIVGLRDIFLAKKNVKIDFGGSRPAVNEWKYSAFKAKESEFSLTMERITTRYENAAKLSAGNYVKRETEKYRVSFRLESIQSLALLEESGSEGASTLRIDFREDAPATLTKRKTSLIHKPTTRKKGKPKDGTTAAIEIVFLSSEKKAAQKIHRLIERLQVLYR